MKRLLRMIALESLLLGIGSSSALAKEPAPAKTKVFDLNQVDLEQVEDNWDNTTPNAPVNLDRGPKIKDIVEPSSEYTYASFGKPDPFALPDFSKAIPVEEEEPMGSIEAGPTGKEIAIQSPLQAYPIDSLTVKGVWQLENGDMRAVILTPKNEGIVIKNGDPMSSGKVLQIDKDSILVRLYRLRKDGVREYEDKQLNFGTSTRVAKGTIKLEPGKAAQFPGMESPADSNPSPDAKNAAPFPPVPKAAQKMEKAAGDMSESVKEANAAKAKAAAAPAPGAAPAASAPSPQAAGGNPPGWPYNMTPPPSVPAPTSGRPGASVK